MTIEEAILEKVRMLPPEKQHEVLDFTEFLQARASANGPRKPLRGLWKDLGVSITEKRHLPSAAGDVGQLSVGRRLKPGLVVDTHAALWYLADDPALSVRAAAALDAITIAGRPIYVPAICVVEAIYLAEKGRIPGTALERLLRALQEPNPRFVLAPLDWIVAISLRVNDVVISCKVAPRSLLLPARGWRPGGLRYPAAQPARPGSH